MREDLAQSVCLGWRVLSAIYKVMEVLSGGVSALGALMVSWRCHGTELSALGGGFELHLQSYLLSVAVEWRVVTPSAERC